MLPYYNEDEPTFRDTLRTGALVFIAECGPFYAMQAEVYLLQKLLDEQVAKLHFRALWEHEFTALVRTQVKALVFKRNYGLVKGSRFAPDAIVPVSGTGQQRRILRDGLS